MMEGQTVVLEAVNDFEEDNPIRAVAVYRRQKDPSHLCSHYDWSGIALTPDFDHSYEAVEVQTFVAVPMDADNQKVDVMAVVADIRN